MVVEWRSELWVWDARRSDGWTFTSLPAGVSEEIRELTAGSRRGFGSVRVRVTIGGSTWLTSIFPDSASGCYVLPVKRSVRVAEGVEAGDPVSVSATVVDLPVPPEVGRPPRSRRRPT